MVGKERIKENSINFKKAGRKKAPKNKKKKTKKKEEEERGGMEKIKLKTKQLKEIIYQ